MGSMNPKSTSNSCFHKGSVKEQSILLRVLQYISLALLMIVPPCRAKQTSSVMSKTRRGSRKFLPRYDNTKKNGVTVNYCVPNRHVHLSSDKDASNSIIVSFSSHQCDLYINKILQKQQQQLKSNSDHILDDYNYTTKDILFDYHSSKKKSKVHDYSSYQDLKALKSGVIISTHLEDVVQFGMKKLDDDDDDDRSNMPYSNSNSKSNDEKEKRDTFIVYNDNQYTSDGEIEEESHGKKLRSPESRITRYNATFKHGKDKIHYWSEYQHHLVVRGLKPNTRYYYKCFVEYIDIEEESSSQEAKKASSSPTNSSFEDSQSEEFIDDMDDDYYNDDKANNETSDHHNHNHVYEDYDRTLQERRNPHETPLDIDHHRNSTYTFKTAPQINQSSIIRMAVVADLGVFDHSRETLKVLASNGESIDFIILAGDISYANGYHPLWDEFFDFLDDSKLFRNKPLYTAAGNHDVESDAETGKIFTSYESRFLMPHIANAQIGQALHKDDFDLNKMYKLPYEYGNSYYSFKYGPSYNIVLNAFADFEPGSKQYQWLQNELKVNRNVTPWLTITVHCPLYSTFSQHHNDPQLLNLKKYLEPLFVTHKVNIVMSGHLHAYMRTKNVAFSKVDKNGPVHLVLGNGGRQANAPFLNQEPEEWVGLRDHTTYGYGFIEFLNYTTARYEWIQSGHNKPCDRGKNFLDVPDNLTDVMYFQNIYFPESL